MCFYNLTYLACEIGRVMPAITMLFAYAVCIFVNIAPTSFPAVFITCYLDKRESCRDLFNFFSFLTISPKISLREQCSISRYCPVFNIVRNLRTFYISHRYITENILTISRLILCRITCCGQCLICVIGVSR